MIWPTLHSSQPKCAQMVPLTRTFHKLWLSEVFRPYFQRSLDKCALAGEWARERAREHWCTGTYAADGYFTFARASLAASASAAMARCSWTGRRTSLLQMIQCYDYWRPWAFLLQKAVHTTVKVIAISPVVGSFLGILWELADCLHC